MIHLYIKKLSRFDVVTTATHRAGWDLLHVCVDDASRLAYTEILPTRRHRRRHALDQGEQPSRKDT